jgi:hypothetical protein
MQNIKLANAVASITVLMGLCLAPVHGADLIRIKMEPGNSLWRFVIEDSHPLNIPKTFPVDIDYDLNQRNPGDRASDFTYHRFVNEIPYPDRKGSFLIWEEGNKDKAVLMDLAGQWVRMEGGKSYILQNNSIKSVSHIMRLSSDKYGMAAFLLESKNLLNGTLTLKLLAQADMDNAIGLPKPKPKLNKNDVINYFVFPEMGTATSDEKDLKGNLLEVSVKTPKK